jgi:hypothetical protein
MKTKLLSVFFAAAVLSGCGSDPEKPQPTADVPPPAPSSKAESGDTGVFGWLGVTGDSSTPSTSSSSSSSSSSGLKPEDRKGVAVNAYLWRSSLDSLSFMPMEQTDPFAGIIKTGWYTPPSTPNERLKVSVFILDTRLRAEAVRVSIFKEAKKPAGEWATATVDPETVTKLENVILDRARQLKIQSE